MIEVDSHPTSLTDTNALPRDASVSYRQVAKVLSVPFLLCLSSRQSASRGGAAAYEIAHALSQLDAVPHSRKTSRMLFRIS